MALTVSQALSSALVLLHDKGAVRWPVSELVGWLNEGIRHAVDLKPDLSTEIVTIDLVQGVQQTVPATVARVVRFLNNTGGAAITMANPEMLDRFLPQWRGGVGLGQVAKVLHVIADEADDRAFMVYPPNDGTGQINVLALARPATIALATPDPEAIAAYSGVDLPFDDAAGDALVDYVVARAYQKDIDLPGVAQRAMMHYQQFAQKLGVAVQAEVMLAPQVPPRDPEA